MEEKNPNQTNSAKKELVIEKILKKYDLWKIQQDGIDKFFKAGSQKERINLFKELPGTKINELINIYADGEISLKKLPPILERELNLSSQNAQKISQDLMTDLLISIKPATKESARKKLTPSPRAKDVEKSTAIIKPSPLSIKTKSSGKDAYREATE